MLTEVKAAVRFLTQLLLKSVVDSPLPGGALESFERALETRLCSHYRDHWFPERPHWGSAFRCIRINHKMDPLLAEVGRLCGIANLSELFPLELTLWVDPYEVSFRFGENGSIGTVYSEAGGRVPAFGVGGGPQTPRRVSRGPTDLSSSPQQQHQVRTPATDLSASPQQHHYKAQASAASSAVAASSSVEAILASCKEQFLSSAKVVDPSFRHLAAAFVTS